MMSTPETAMPVPPASKQVNTVLLQHSPRLGQLRRFEIYNDKFIKITQQNLFGRRHYHLNLTMLEPWPVHHRRIAWHWLMALVYFALATLLFGYYTWLHQEAQILNRLLPFMVGFILLALGSLILFIYQSPNVTEFRSRYGNCPLLRLHHNKPDRENFRHFVAELKMRILAASQAATLDKQQMLAIEQKELQRLADEGVLSKEDYRRARQRIMNVHF